MSQSPLLVGDSWDVNVGCWTLRFCCVTFPSPFSSVGRGPSEDEVEALIQSRVSTKWWSSRMLSLRLKPEVTPCLGILSQAETC